jgi:hypothetical protein
MNAASQACGGSGLRQHIAQDGANLFLHRPTVRGSGMAQFVFEDGFDVADGQGTHAGLLLDRNYMQALQALLAIFDISMASSPCRDRQ